MKNLNISTSISVVGAGVNISSAAGSRLTVRNCVELVNYLMDQRFGDVDNVAKFFISIPSIAYCQEYLCIPVSFMNKYKYEVPSNVIIHVKNGDMFEVKYNRYCNCFVGVQKLYDRYCLGYSEYLFFEYWGGNEFGLVIFNSLCVEMEYPMPPLYHSVFESPGLTLPFVHPSIELSDLSLDEDLNAALSDINSQGGWQSFEILVHDSTIITSELCPVPLETDFVTDIIPNGTSIKLHFSSRNWDVLLQRSSLGSSLGDGWCDFVNATGLSIGDLCVMQKESEDHHFLVGIYKDFYGSVLRRSEGCNWPTMFMKKLDVQSIETGEIVSYSLSLLIIPVI